MERLSIQLGSDELTLETGKIAKQAHGSVLARMGDTIVLTAVCVADESRPGQDFFPMTVDYREKGFAAGKIPGNFFRREGRPSEREILVCRLTDRPLRPLFPKSFLNELQVFSTVFSTDNENNPDVISINAASAALHISKVPFNGPIGAVRVGCVDGELVVNPKFQDMEASDLDLVIAGTADSIIMVEGAAQEFPEDKMLEALEFGHGHIKAICAAIEDLRAKVGQPKMEVPEADADAEVATDVEALAADPMRELLAPIDKHARADGMKALKKEVKEKLLEKYGEEKFAEREGGIGSEYGKLKKRLMREQVVKTNTRLDGRGLATVRPISIEVGILPRVHGSCLFTRGETQAIVTTTLGTSGDEQRMDELTGDVFKRFMLHYNFPSWSVGEVRRIMGPGRREVGHGKLAERALERVLPFSLEEEGEPGDSFPYTIRVVSDITESNGSSSMASVCGGSLSLMDAGVPIKAPVAGIAMGLIKEGDEVRVLTDILGDEDHLGDMDFKVTGTSEGITAFQMDCKIAGVSREVMTQALQQARDGRMHILEKMNAVLAKHRDDISPYAPRIFTIMINPDKIRDIIGPGGKIIRHIQRTTGAEIEIDDDGTVLVAATTTDIANEAIDMIKNITAEPEVGQIYKGKVSRIMNFGAFVSIMGGKEGLVHISELAPYHVRSVQDVVDIGDDVQVKVVEIDSMGRVNLSKVAAELELGLIEESDIEKPQGDDGRGRGGDRGRGGRGGDRGGGGRGGDRGGGGRRERSGHRGGGGRR